MNKLEEAKLRLHLSKLKTAREEKMFKILEREEDIERIKKEVVEYDKNIDDVEKQLEK